MNDPQLPIEDPQQAGCQPRTCSAGRWIVKYQCWNDEGETQVVGARWFEEQPTEDEIEAVFESVKAANFWARRFALKVEQQNAATLARAAKGVDPATD